MYVYVQDSVLETYWIMFQPARIIATGSVTARTILPTCIEQPASRVIASHRCRVREEVYRTRREHLLAMGIQSKAGGDGIPMLVASAHAQRARLVRGSKTLPPRLLLEGRS